MTSRAEFKIGLVLASLYIPLAAICMLVMGAVSAFRRLKGGKV